MRIYLTIFSLSVPFFLSVSAAFAHSSLSDNVSRLHDLNHSLEVTTNLVGLTILGAITLVALLHLNINKKRV